MDWPTFQHVLDKGGLVLVLGWLVIGFMRGWVVPGYLHKRQGRERDELFELALRSSGASEEAIRIAKRTARDLAEDMPS